MVPRWPKMMVKTSKITKIAFCWKKWKTFGFLYVFGTRGPPQKSQDGAQDGSRWHLKSSKTSKNAGRMLNLAWCLVLFPQDNPKWSQDAPKNASECPKMDQDCIKMVPRWTKIASRWCKRVPEWPKSVFDGSKIARDGPKMAQNCIKMVQNCPRKTQNDPKMAFHGPKITRNGPKMAQDCTKMGQYCPRKTPYFPPKKKTKCKDNPSLECIVARSLPGKLKS